MTETIQVYLIRRRYNNPVGMETADVSRFIHLMEKFASDLGTEYPTISAPAGSESIRFDFEVGDE